MSRPRRRLRRALILPAVALAVTLPAAIPAPASAAPCAHADVTARKGSLPQVRTAVLCLVNRERAAHGLNQLRPSARLRRAARRHSADMVRRRYFAHRSPEGKDLVVRARRARYVPRRRTWQLAENLAWQPAQSATASALVQAWMASPGHRANVLRAGMRDLGVGLRLGTPVGGRGVTATTLFGRRG